ncbi:MAG: DeoR family transcriptional regulator [Minisyncoccia bacterium]
MSDSPITRLQVSVEKKRAKKRERLEKIAALATQKGSITNNSVQILLGVSDATATRYLVELVKAGHLKRISSRAGSRYEPQV